MSTTKIALKRKAVKISSATGIAKVTNLQEDYNSTTSPLIVTYTYQNHMPYPVSIIEKSGIAHTLPVSPINRLTKNGVTVLKRYRFLKEVIIDATDLLNGNTESIELKAIKEAFEIRRGPTNGPYVEFDVRYHVSSRDLSDYGGALYMNELDIVISTDNPRNAAHPFSPEQKLLKSSTAVPTGAFLHFVLNDCAFKVARLFANINGEVYKFNSIDDREKPDGVYVYSHSYEDDEDHQFVRCIRYSVEEAMEKYPLFLTELDARAYGNVEERMNNDLETFKDKRKLDILDKESDLKVTTIEEKNLVSKLVVEKEVRAAITDKLAQERNNELSLIQQKMKEHEASMSRERAEYEQRNKVWEYEMQKSKQESEAQMIQLKHMYEARSYNRKDSSEFLKWIPAIIGAGIMIPKLMG